MHFFYLNVCVFAITCALRWGVTLVGEFIYWALLTPSWEKYFQVLEVHRGMKYIQDLSCEKGSDYGLFMYFVKFWIFIQFLLNFGHKT